MESGQIPRAPRRLTKTKIAFVSILLVSVAWLLISPPNPGQPPDNSELQIELSDPGYLSGSTMRLRGTIAGAHQATAIRLVVNGLPVADTWSEVDPEQTTQPFHFDEVHLRSGENDAYVIAVSFLNGRRVEGTEEVTLPSPESATNVDDQTTAPAGPLPAPTPRVEYQITRKMALSLRYNRMDLNLAATMPKNDGRLRELMSGQKTLPQFIESVFGDYTVQGNPVADEFRNVTPEYDFSDHNVTVSAATDPRRQRGTIALTNSLTIRPDWRPEENANDEFLLNVADYKMRAFDPPPSSASRESAKWLGKQEELTNGQFSEIKIQLQFESTSPRNILGLLSLSPYEVLPASLYSIIGLISGLLVAVPMLWFLWLLANYGEAAGSVVFNAALANLARTLVAFAFTPHVAYLLNTLASLAYGRLGLDRQDDPRLIIGVAIAVAAGAQLLSLLATFIRSPKLRSTLQSMLSGMRDAGLICLAIVCAVLIGLKAFSYNRIHLAQLLAAMIAFSSAFWLLVQVTRVFRGRPDEEGPYLRKWLTWLIPIVILGVVPILAYPSQPGGIFETFITNIHDEALTYVQEFFLLLLNLLPYVLFLGIASLLWVIEARSDHGRKLFVSLGALLFAGFIVGPTSTLLMIPLPFLIAIWAFRHYVLVRPADRVFEIEEIRDGISGDRSAALQIYFSSQKLSRLEATLETLEKNRLAGDVSDADYQALKRELEEKIARCENDARLADNIAIQDVVLGIGPMKSNWENAMWAVRRGAVIALLFSAIYLWGLLQRDVWPPRPYYLLAVVSPLLAFFGYWIVCAFFFGYFYVCFRGNSGLRKGVVVSSTVILSLLPVWLVSSPAPLAIFLRSGQTFLFFSFLGFLADHQVFKAALGVKFEWKKLMQFEEIRNFAAFATIILTSLATSVQSALAGRADLIVNSLVDLAFQQLPKMPPLL